MFLLGRGDGCEVRGETPRGVCDWGGPGQGQRVTAQGQLRVGRCLEVSVVDGCAGFGCTCVHPSGQRHVWSERRSAK